MGMYTELVLNVALNDETPAEVIETLRYMTTGTGTEPSGDHEMFKTDRWFRMLRSGSFYFIPEAQSKLIKALDHTNHLSIRCDLKNYSGEIEAFLSWIAPHVESFGGPVFGGYKRYEEDEHPTLVYFNDGSVEYRSVGV